MTFQKYFSVFLFRVQHVSGSAKRESDNLPVHLVRTDEGKSSTLHSRQKEGPSRLPVAVA